MTLVRRHLRRGTTTYEWRPVTVQNDRRPGIWSRAANAANAANDRDDDDDDEDDTLRCHYSYILSELISIVCVSAISRLI